MSQSASESLPPDTATSTRSPGSSMRCEWIARRTCSSQWWTKCSLQNAALWRRTSITAGCPRHTRHFMVDSARPPLIGHAAPPLITGRISTEASSASLRSWVTSSSPTMTSTVSGTELEALQQRVTVIGPSTSTSRFGLRSSTFTRRRLPAYFVRRISRISSRSPGLSFSVKMSSVRPTYLWSRRNPVAPAAT